MGTRRRLLRNAGKWIGDAITTVVVFLSAEALLPGMLNVVTGSFSEDSWIYRWRWYIFLPTLVIVLAATALRRVRDARSSVESSKPSELWPQRLHELISYLRRWIEPQLDDVETRAPRLLELPYHWRSKHGEGESVGSVHQRFHDHGEQLLILGGAGSGKSVLMLKLMKELAEEARQEETKVDRKIPFPVSIGVSEPAPEDFLGWVAHKIAKQSRLPEPRVVELLEYGRIIPCVENLELVSDTDRELWAQRIDAYTDQPMANLVLTCRTDTYASLATKPKFGLVVTLTGLAPEDLDGVLAQSSGDYTTARRLLDRDAALREMCTTPLWLSVVSKLGTDADSDSVRDMDVLQYLRREFRTVQEPNTEPSALLDRARHEYTLSTAT